MMKKTIVILLLVLLVFTGLGCDNDGFSRKEAEYYKEINYLLDDLIRQTEAATMSWSITQISDELDKFDKTAAEIREKDVPEIFSESHASIVKAVDLLDKALDTYYKSMVDGDFGLMAEADEFGYAGGEYLSEGIIQMEEIREKNAPETESKVPSVLQRVTE